MSNKHHSSTRCHELADLFLFLHLSDPKARVDMDEPEFHPCKTVACHAGWFAMASGKKEWSCYTYDDASDEMAQFLGFVYAGRLKRWMYCNSDIWGNHFGLDMFSSSEAFEATDKTINLKVISNHWRGVAMRLEERGF